MTDEPDDQQDEDALFDRLARNLEAVRQDAALARSRGGDAMSAGLARVETELRDLAGVTDALRQRVEQQDALTEYLEAVAAKGQADIQALQQAVDALSRRLRQHGEVIADSLAQRSWPRVIALLGIVLVVLVVAAGAAGWIAAGGEPSIGAQTHFIVQRLAALTGIGRTGPGEPKQGESAQSHTAMAQTQATPNPNPPQSPSVPAASLAPGSDAAASVVPAGTPVAAQPASAAPPSDMAATAPTAGNQAAPGGGQPRTTPTPASSLSAAMPPAPASLAAVTTPAAASLPTATPSAAASLPTATPSAAASLPTATPPSAASLPTATLHAAASLPAVTASAATSASAGTYAAAAVSPAAAPAASVPAVTTAGDSTPLTAAPLPPAAPPNAQPDPPAPAVAALASPSQVSHPVGRIVLRATADTWVRVRQDGGPVLLTRVMNAGETWPVPAEPKLLLDTGNATGLILEVDGVPTKLIGAKLDFPHFCTFGTGG